VDQVSKIALTSRAFHNGEGWLRGPALTPLVPPKAAALLAALCTGQRNRQR